MFYSNIDFRLSKHVYNHLMKKRCDAFTRILFCSFFSVPRKPGSLGHICVDASVTDNAEWLLWQHMGDVMAIYVVPYNRYIIEQS